MTHPFSHLFEKGSSRSSSEVHRLNQLYQQMSSEISRTSGHISSTSIEKGFGGFANNRKSSSKRLPSVSKFDEDLVDVDVLKKKI